MHPASFLGAAGGATLAVMLHADGPGKTLGAREVCSCARAQTLQPVRGPAEALTQVPENPLWETATRRSKDEEYGVSCPC